MFYECPYCTWCGEEPNSAEYSDEQEYAKAIADFRDEQDNHPCS